MQRDEIGLRECGTKGSISTEPRSTVHQRHRGVPIRISSVSLLFGWVPTFGSLLRRSFQAHSYGNCLSIASFIKAGTFRCHPNVPRKSCRALSDSSPLQRALSTLARLVDVRGHAGM